MKLMKRGSKFYLVKRVPAKFSNIEPRKQVWIALRTDSPAEAKRRAHDAARDLENQWLSKLTGERNDIKRYDALSALAASRGFPYLPADQVAQQNLQEILSRTTAASESHAVADAVLGSAKKPTILLSSLLDIYMELVAVEVKDKGRDQRRIWENTLKRAMNRLVSVIGDKGIDELSREDALAYRNHWVGRIESEGLTPTSANRELTTVAGIFSKLYKLKGLCDPTLFKGLAFTAKRKHRPPYEADYVRKRIIPILDTGLLNEDATDVLCILINTGMRPSEVTGLAATDIYLNSEVPYVSIRPRKGRELKTQTSIRDIPLVGIALEAAQRHQDGFSRYFDKTGSLSQTINKFLKVNNLRPCPDHSVYSFRHGFQDRLTAVEAPDRIQADLMGHRYVRERYGVGPSLAQKAQWLSKIGFF